MIVSRSVLRANRVWKISSPHITPYAPKTKQLNQMDGGRKSPHFGENTKKRKTADLVWRPVYSQASTDVVGANTIGTDKIYEDMECGNSRSVLVVSEDTKIVVEQFESATISEAFEGTEAEVTETKSEECPEKHAMSIEVGASLLRFIEGKGGITQRKIEDEMGVKLIFPSSKREESVIIKGDSRESVERAAEKVQIIVDEAVQSPNLNYSHFVSLPLAIHPELVEKLVSFQNSILGAAKVKTSDIPSTSCQSKTPKFSSVSGDGERVSASEKFAYSGIEKSIFNKPKTFHLTVLMLKLWNKDRVNVAMKVLKRISSKVMDALEGRPVVIRLKGLDAMKGSLAKARVLYAPVEELGGEERLFRACQVIIDAYIEAGLVLEKDAKQTLRLHATVMNASHRKRKSGGRKYDSFDAREVVKQYGSEDWGDYLISEAHLSQRFVFDENGYYHCCASIPFPGNPQSD